MSLHPLTEGPRACRPDEVSEMIALANSVMRQGSTQSFLTDYPLVYTEENLPHVQIMKTDNTIVSVVPYLPKQIATASLRFGVGIISPTATHPAYRRQGHARRCLDACLDLMEAERIELSVLWTLPATFPFYEQSGFQGVPAQMDWAHATRADAAAFPSQGHSIEVLDPGNAQHLRAVETLRSEPLHGVVRSTRETAALFSLPKTTTFLACEGGGEIRGYLLFCAGTHKPGILEAGGCPAAVESLLHHTLLTSALTETPIYLTKECGVLSRLLHERLPHRIRPMETGPMMVRINDAFAFLTALRPWLETHCISEKRSGSLEISETGQIIGFDYDSNREETLVLSQNRSSNHHIVTRRELTSLIFGTRDSAPPTPACSLIGSVLFSLPIPMLDHS